MKNLPSARFTARAPASALRERFPAPAKPARTVPCQCSRAGMAKETEPLIDIKEVALRLGLKVRGVRSMITRRVIPVLRLSKTCLRFRWSEVEAAINRYRVEAFQ
jgi:predicted DNA-binding transcriptional regulator AlpA